MKIIIVATQQRSEWAHQLADALGENFACLRFDCANAGSLEGHRAALEIAAAMNDRVVIMEDDVIPVQGFAERAQAWIDAHPHELISFYLGTSRPRHWQAQVDQLLPDVPENGYITLPALIHGCCYTLPPGKVRKVLSRMPRGRAAADEVIGQLWERDVLYPVQSLVEHADGGVSVERHLDGQPRTERRVARRLAAPLMYQRGEK